MREKLGEAAQMSFAAVGHPFEKKGITSWNFGDLPETLSIERDGARLMGYPALVDVGASVSLSVLDSAAAARAAMRGGLRRLFMIQVADELKYLSRKLSGVEQMCLFYSRLGPCEELKRDLLTAVADRALFGDDDDEAAGRIRSRDAFAARAETGWRRLTAAGDEVAHGVFE